MEAVRQLIDMGFSLWVEGGKIKYRYAGPGQPDPDLARRLLAKVAMHKAEAVAYLVTRPAPHRARPMLPPVLTVQDRPGGPPCYGPTDEAMEAAYLADERAGLQLY